VRWEVGAHTRAGRLKQSLKKHNEDHVLVRHLRGPERALVAVADGISVCEVGSGTLASWLACLVFENVLGPDTTAATFPERAVEACRRAAGDLLGWALERHYKRDLEGGRHLMGTTLTAGWLEGNRLLVANVGDSRAYLVEPDNVEQLTVDGDLASGLHAMRVPPEEVRSLGGMGRALQRCVGGFTRTDSGELTVSEQTCTPQVSSWPLVPGDVVVLCSDGLVDEGHALEPEQMAALVRQNARLGAEELAALLAEAADALQRVPCDAEPDGQGDNISCVVIKVTAPDDLASPSR
jgi:protein phosphatase